MYSLIDVNNEENKKAKGLFNQNIIRHKIKRNCLIKISLDIK